MPFLFAYGGNTNPNHIARSYPNIKNFGVFLLPSHEIVCRSIPPTAADIKTSFDETVFCDIIKASDDEKVEGVVYHLTEKELEQFDEQEHLHIIYERTLMLVVDKNDSKHYLHAWVYKMIDQTQPICTPSKRYQNVVEAGYKHHGIQNKIHEFSS